MSAWFGCGVTVALSSRFTVPVISMTFYIAFFNCARASSGDFGGG
jgi:hypothetical protein